MAEDNANRAEHELISTSLDVEQLDINLFRSKSLWVPVRARGVFGGQVISQAIVSATNCVELDYRLHSLHCYFLLSASPSLPILYYVERLRTGKSYTTRFVRAAQKGKVIFIMICSFHRPEPEHPFHHWPMPKDVPPAEKLELDVVGSRRQANEPGVGEKVKQFLLEFAADRERSPLLCTMGVERRDEDGTLTILRWIKARNIPVYAPAFQKCILGYMSDYTFIGTAPRALGLKRYSKGPGAQGMTSSLDHSIFFYSDDFDCSQWLLFVTKSPRTGDGRGVVEGQIYTQSGSLIAFITQEGVVRSDVGRPERKEKPKL
ncbi:Thioesterase/thiol ester dehydrase-isomerase [Schizopora paradoxa]|uniref:Thioesterase/thiol ester dehydrase-isomerase n=1 Tax=Schizopora paradoxa TaxID=27342 RepID=A0A0H2RZI7_9AGAM|nr:Thioesterase/thiol ester dehydrase-isomerase [Schizopora paradoxa]